MRVNTVLKKICHDCTKKEFYKIDHDESVIRTLLVIYL